LKVGKRIPVLSIALAGVDFASRKAAGQRTSQAAGGAAGSVIGGMAGGFLGSFLDPFIGPFGTILGGMAGSTLGDMVGSKLGPFFADLPKHISKYLNPVNKAVADLPKNLGFVAGQAAANLNKALGAIKQWFINLPQNLGFAIGKAVVNLQKAWASLSTWFSGLGPTFSTLLTRTVASIKGKWSMFIRGVANVFSGKTNWGAVLKALEDGIGGMINSLVSYVQGFAGKFMQGFRAGQVNASSGGKVKAKAFGESRPFSGGLHEAISFEMANKPAGSDLVIANSSETIIPAATGLNTGGIAEGLANVVSAIQDAANKTTNAYEVGFFKLSNRLHHNHLQYTQTFMHSTQVTHKQNQDLMSAINASSTRAAAGGMAGGAGGAGLAGMAGGAGAGSSGSVIAGQLGDYIKATGGAPGSIHEHPRHGGVRGRHAPGSYHYSGRAIDIGAYAYEQGGVLARVAQFNAKMGVRPVELLKAGDPGHSDHVHVAYAMGLGNPAYFPTQSDAMEWEGKMMPPGASVRSVTTNSSENLGGAVTVNAPITINQKEGQDAEQLASIVALRLGEAVMQARSSSIQY